MRRCLLLTCLPVVVLALASCGGSSNSTSTDTTAAGSGDTTAAESGDQLSKAQFIAQADDICKSIREEDASLETRFRELSQTASSTVELKEVAQMIRKLTSYTARAAAQLNELEPPAADAKTIDDLLAAVETRNSVAGEYAKAIEEGDKKSVGSLTKKAAALTAKASGIAEGYGLKVCGAKPQGSTKQ